MRDQTIQKYPFYCPTMFRNEDLILLYRWRGKENPSGLPIQGEEKTGVLTLRTGIFSAIEAKI